VRCAGKVVAVSLLWLWSAAAVPQALAQALAQAPAPLTQGDDALSFPSVARVLVAFLFTVGLAVGVAYAARRWMPAFRSGLLRGQPQRLQVVERIQLSAVTRLHLVDIDENRVLIAESRNGVSLTVLPARNTNENKAGKE
jgi:flagellar biogenesis protein FliO